MLKDNILEDGMSIMSFNIGKLIVINDERTDVSTLRKHRGPYLQAHASVLSNIDTLSADVSRVFSLSFASILFGQNKDSEEWDTPNSTIFATLLTMFSLFDQCAVLLCNKLGEMISPEEAVFFGVKSNQTVIELANRARPEHIGLLLSAFGFVSRLPAKRSCEPWGVEVSTTEEESWRSLLTILRGRIVHRQGVFSKVIWRKYRISSSKMDSKQQKEISTCPITEMDTFTLLILCVSYYLLQKNSPLWSD